MDFGLPNGFVCLRNRMPFKVNVNFSIRQSMWAEERSRWHTTLARILDYPTFLITCGKATSIFPYANRYGLKSVHERSGRQ
ncbi:unnamed protein product [Macrosiphum euphorbiae]|uniref:Uncharacterized protein n=1 Tax=Macrosiphum euphorbiae TaxID=13131 RepID=A0AAV0Y738_9HEMI|nr:unnamed protein product [Macrosiphum euphorbiae]